MKKLILAILGLIILIFLISYVQPYPLSLARHVFEGLELEVPFTDTDRDGLPDIEEIQLYYTNATNSDTDFDGLPDGWEAEYRLYWDDYTSKYHPTDPNQPDAEEDYDLDKLTNRQEWLAGTHPGNNDTDFDGMLDGWEVLYNLNPLANDSSLDADNDGLSNLEEYLVGTSPINNDTDSDGISDSYEIYIGTNPTNPDTDFDGMPDGWEVYYGLNPLVDDAGEDADNDELTNLEEYLSGTDPKNWDTDNDRMPDGWEYYHDLDPLVNDALLDEDADNLTNLEEWLNSTDPRASDTDDDKLLDGEEVKIYGTNPLEEDTDGDALTDYDEIFVYGTNPLKRDTDSEGLNDYEELFIYKTNATNRDTDEDGLTDYEEIFLKSCFPWLASRYPDIIATNPLNPDTDNDALWDGEEVKTWSINPNDWDSDNDGMPDGWETYYAKYKIDDYWWNIDPRRDDSHKDADNDNLTNFQEYNWSMPSWWSVSLNGTWWGGTDPNDWDTDDDGMPDGWEVFYGLNPKNKTDAGEDIDHDALTNLEEYLNDTYPNDWDSDDDGMPDGWEVYYQLNPLLNDSFSDADNDNLTNLQEYSWNISLDWNVSSQGVWWNGTNPQDWDTDDDQMPDGWETDYELNPILNDSYEDKDNDNLTNLEEYLICIPLNWNVSLQGVWWNGTDPTNEDCDYDRLLDGDEVNAEHVDSEVDWDGDGELNYNTNPKSPDSDGDGFLDGWSITLNPTTEKDLCSYFKNWGIAWVDNKNGTLTFYGELSMGTQPLVPDSNTDSDGDGLPNWYEAQIGTNPNNPDTDGDWLWDGDELQKVEKDGYPNTYLTDPLSNDTDTGGCWDGWEVVNGFDPTKPADDSEDPDWDELPNWFEFSIGTNPNHPDSDGDRLLDGFNITVNKTTQKELYDYFIWYDIVYEDHENGTVTFIGELIGNLSEWDYFTDPLNPDTDGDNYTEGEEIEQGTDPNDNTSYPQPPQYSTDINITSIYPIQDIYYIGDKLTVTGWVKNASNGNEFLPNITVKIYFKHKETGALYCIGSGKTNESGWFNITCEISQEVPAGEFSLVACAVQTLPYQESWDEEVW